MKVVLKSKQYRKRKEIYHVDIDVLKDVLKGCDKLITKTNRVKIKKNKNELVNKISTIDKEKDYNYFMYVDKLEDNIVAPTNEVIDI